MILILSGPSGIGKTDTSFALMSNIEKSVYLDSDWFCAKNPFNVFYPENINQVYDSICMNIIFQKERGYQNFIIPIYLEAYEYFKDNEKKLLIIDNQVFKCILFSTPDAHIQRIESRNRLAWMKENEIIKSKDQLETSKSFIESDNEIIGVDTTSLKSVEIAKTIIREIEIKTKKD